MANIFDIRESLTGNPTATPDKKKKNIFDINQFISEYKPEPVQSVPVPTTIPTAQVQTPVASNKDYFKETQMQKLDTPAQTSNKWAGMDIKNNIIPQAKDFSKPAKVEYPETDKETVKKGIAADWKNIWDGIAQRFLGTASIFFTNPVANSANNQLLGGIGGKIAEVTTGDKTASYQGASEQAYKELKAEQLTPEYKKEQENRQEAIDKAAKIVDDWAEKNKLTSTISAGAGGLEQGTKNLVKGLGGALYKDELFGIKTYDSGGVLSSGYQQAAQDNKGIEKLLGDLTYSVGNMAPTMLIGSIAGSPGLGAALMGLGSAQGNYEERRKQGYDHTSSLAYGVLTGASEGALQYFIGSIPGLSVKSAGGALIKSPIARKLVSVIDDVFKLSSKSPVVQGLVKTAVNSTVDISSEALEEGLQEYIYAGLNKLIFDEDVSYFGKGGLLESSAYSAFLGGLTGGILGVPGTAQTNSAFKKEAQKNAKLQADVDKFKQRVAEQVIVPPDATILTPEQITAGRVELQRQIAEETDPELKSMLQDSLNAYNAEISTKTPQTADLPAGVQVDAQRALDTTTPAQLGENSTETQATPQPQTTDNIFDLGLSQTAQTEPAAVTEQPIDENLANFKQEVDTAKADIQSRADLTEEEKADVLAHIDTVYSEITAQTAEPVKQNVAPAEKVYTAEPILAQEAAVAPVKTLTAYEKKITNIAKTKLNRKVVFSENIPEGADGMIKDGIIYIRRGADINYVFGHELTHALEASKGYESLAKYITENVIGADNMDSAVSAMQERYKKVSPDMSIDGARAEVIAEQAAKLLFADKASVAAIVRSDKGLATKILTFLRETATKLAGTEQQKAVLKAAAIYRDALKETTEKTKQAPKSPAKSTAPKTTAAQEKSRVAIAEKIANDSKTSGAITVDGQQAIIDGYHGVLLNTPLPILERSDDNAQALYNTMKSTIEATKKGADTSLDLPTVDWLQTYVANAKKIRTQANIYETLLKSTTGLQKKVELLTRVNSDKTGAYKENLLKKLNGKQIPEQIAILDGEIVTLGKYLQDRRYFAENKSGVMYDFGGKLPLVNAELLLDMIKLLPNAKAMIKVNQQSPPILYFDGGNIGEGVLLPIRPNAAGMRINSFDINNSTMMPEPHGTPKYAIPPSGNTVNRVGKLKSESTEKLYLAGEKYGFHNPTYKKMPLPLRMDETDSRMVGKTINTILRTDWVNNSGAKDLADDIVSGKATYQRITDKFAENKARKIIKTGGYDEALAIWDGKIAENKRMTKVDIVMAELILEQAAKQGDNALVRKLVSEVAMIATETGQVSQAINVFNKLSGNSQLRAAEMLAKRLNKMFQKRLDKLGSVIEVNKELAKELKKATTEEEKQRIQEEIKLDLIDQLPPATFREKWDAWRMTSMLGNLRTGVRNLAGNTLFVPPILAKNFLAFAMEEATNKAVVDKITKIAEKIKTTKDTNEVVRLLAKASGDKTYIKRMTDVLNSTTNKMAQKALIDTEIANLNERVQFNRGIIKTKALKADKDAKDFSADDFQYVQVVLTGAGKYELAHKGIFESRTIFNSKVTDKLGFDKVKLGKKGKTLQDFTSLEGYRKNTIYMLEDSPIGDKRYLAMHYKRALASFLTANNVDMDAVKVAQEAINEGNTLDTYAAKMLQIGREYAIKEAQEATFRNKNKLADSLNDFADNHGIAADIVINGALPFKKTPINILYRGLEYSPAGLVKTLTVDSVRLKRGDIDVTDYINKIAKGITGSGVVLLGMGLAAAGILSGDLSDDETERKLQEQQGFQKYSIKVGDTWYSIDWAAPISLPLFLGVEILRIYEQHNGLQYKDITEGLINMTAPVINMSMLSGISEMISNLRYKTTPQAALASLPVTAVRSYFTQGIPTLLGQVSRTLDGTRRTMSTAEDDQLNADQQYFLQKIKSKIPGVSNQAEPYLDIWGIEEPKKNVFSRAAENFFSPGYVKNSKEDNLANIMLDLKGKASPDLDVSVMPFTPDRTLTYDTKEYSLTASQLTEVRRLTGAAQQAAAQAFLEKNKPVKLTYENKNKADMTSWVTLSNPNNRSGGKYSNEDLQIKALAKTMKDAREKAVADFIKAHKDLQLKK